MSRRPKFRLCLQREPSGARLSAAAMAMTLAIGLGLGLGASNPARAGDSTLFMVAAVSQEVLGDARGSGLSDIEVMREMRVGVVLWDEVPGPPPRRPTPRQAGEGISATVANAVSLNHSRHNGPGG